MKTSLSYKIFDYFGNAVVSGSGNLTSQINPISSSSSNSATPFCCTTAEKQSHSTENLSYMQARGGFGEESPRKRRRRRTRSDKKIEERESQRMNHIAVERNRRKQMSHFLSTLKSMMPLSYSQRVSFLISFLVVFFFIYLQKSIFIAPLSL